MPRNDDALRAMSRRNFIKTSALAGTAIALGNAGLIRSALAADATVRFSGWAFEPQVVEGLVKRFMAENPGIQVNYTPLDLQLYNEKMVALVNAGSQPDAFYVRDTNLGAWVDAGWLQPIDGMPKLDELNRAIFPLIGKRCSTKASRTAHPTMATFMSTSTTARRSTRRV